MPTYDLNGKGSNRSVNNRPSLINYFGAVQIGPVGPTLPGRPTAPILGTGATVRNRSITDRLVESASIRNTTGPFGTRIKKDPTQLAVLTTGGGVQTVVTKEAGSKGSLPFNSADDRRRQKDFPKSTRPKPLPAADPGTYDWNLPPHKWSLPTEPAVVNAKHYERQGLTRKVLPDRYRRGRIWWRANAPIAVVDAGNNPKTLTEGDFNRKYGFQFLWNPESFGTQVQVQLEATPSVEDRWLGAAGFFPATQTISFTIRIDRTNDFACAQAELAKNNGPYNSQLVGTARLGQDSRLRNRVAANVFTPADVEEFKRFYKPVDAFDKYGNFAGTFDSSGGDAMSRKLIDLFQRGTLADIEYLYKTINGPGPGGAGNQVEWVNGRGIKTADIGYLMPTLVHVDIGPLSYDGYVTGLQVNHISFTPSMVPMRSDLTISLNVLATSALTSGSPTS